MVTNELERAQLQDPLHKHRLWAKGDPEGKRLELREVSLAGADLSELNFSRATLCDVDFSGAELRHAGFTGAQLERVLFREANLEGASFVEARMVDCSFERARFGEAADFQKAELNNVSFTDSVLCGADFSDAILKIVTLDRADLSRADFVAAQVADSSLAGAQLQESILVKASFRNVTLCGANLQRARLNRWSCRDRCDLGKADLSGADLARANFDILDLRDANLEDTKLWKTRIDTGYVHATRGLPFVCEAAGNTALDFSEQADGSDLGDVLRLARQLGDNAGTARFGAGVGSSNYRCRTTGVPGGQQFVIESAQHKSEAIRVQHVQLSDEEGLATLRVKYELIDERFREWDVLAHELIFELVLLGELKDRYRDATDAVLYVNVHGGSRMTDYELSNEGGR